MADTKAADTVPGLGFKDKEKALETIKVLEGRDPDYQKLAIKGLIGRANRTLSITKAEDKLTNIKEAVEVFEQWLKKFEKLNLSKENMPYLPLATVEAFLPLQKHFGIDSIVCKFVEAYKKSAEGDYKRLRTVESGDGEPTWDIVRNKHLKQLKKEADSNNAELWDDDDLPTKIHTQMILWGYSPVATRIKKELDSLKEKVEKVAPSGKKEKKKEESSDDKKEKSKKRKSSGNSDSSSDRSTPEKKKRHSSD